MCSVTTVQLAVWRSSNVIGHINKVTLHRAWLVFGWVTVFGWVYQFGI